LLRGSPSDTMDEPSATDGAPSPTSTDYSTISVDAGLWLTSSDPTQTHEPAEKTKPEALTKREDDFAALFATQAYKSLDTSRPLVKEMFERLVSRPDTKVFADVLNSFLNDPHFRVYVNNYLHPPKYAWSSIPKPKFRLMDLPVELRVHIAEYAMHNPNGLKWVHIQPDVDEERWVQGFNMLMDCFESPYGSDASLTVVSKQLREETKGLLFKVNTLTFSRARYLFFRSKVSAAVLDSIRYLRISVSTNPGLIEVKHPGLKVMLRWIDEASEIPVNTSVSVELTDWCLSVYGKSKATNAFVDQGHSICARLQDLRRCLPRRLVRVWPSLWLMSSGFAKGYFENYLSSEDQQLALDWINNGI
jgi:hypothetical protein